MRQGFPGRETTMIAKRAGAASLYQESQFDRNADVVRAARKDALYTGFSSCSLLGVFCDARLLPGRMDNAAHEDS